MYNRRSERIDSFAEIRSDEYFRNLSDSIRNEIKGESKEKILKIDEDEYKKYLEEKYSLEPLEIDKENKIINQPTKQSETRSNRLGRSFVYEYYEFKVTYPFSGTPSLFKIAPSRRTLASSNVELNYANQTISIQIQIENKDPDEFKKTEQRVYHSAFVNIKNVNPEVDKWNRTLSGLVERFFDSIKKEYLEENRFFEEINVKTDAETDFIFSTPEIKKKIIPKPEVKEGKQFASEPTISEEMYSDILSVINTAGKKMERKPSLYKNKDEEELRDQILFLLETRYEGTTATGETFNKKGKTDIILKYSKDGSNLFVAECKYWAGAKELQEAINQLFDRYLTWRDSKAALIVFVQNKSFTNVLDQIENIVSGHEYFSENKGQNGESSFSFLMHIPEDSDKNVFLEVILFHFPE
jgi:hypothetical protein